MADYEDSLGSGDDTSTVGAAANPPEPAGPDIGADLGGDVEKTPAGTTTTDIAATDGGNSDFDPANVDWLRADPESLPAEYRPLTGLAKNLQKGFTSAMEELRADQRTAQDTQVQLNQALVNQAQQPQNGQAADPYAHLSEEQREAVQAVRDILNIEQGESLKTIQSKQTQLEQGILAVAQAMRQQTASSLQSEASTLRSEYGDDIDNYAQHIQSMMQLPNPKTQKPYTMTEAYELASGKIVQKTIQARQTDNQARNAQTQNTTAVGTVDTSAEAGPLSDNDLLSHIESLGFGTR